jgi:hypothetical protein
MIAANQSARAYVGLSPFCFSGLGGFTAYIRG